MATVAIQQGTWRRIWAEGFDKLANLGEALLQTPGTLASAKRVAYRSRTKWAGTRAVSSRHTWIKIAPNAIYTGGAY